MTFLTGLLLIIHVGYYLFLFTRIWVYKPRLRNQFPGVSVVVCVKNELARLTQLLDFLKKQKYPQYEIIMVDDFSEDGSRALLKAEKGIILVLPEVDTLGKKAALSAGIARAKHPFILTTDGDCLQFTDAWITKMVHHLGDKEICLGYAPLTFTRFSGFFASYEAWLTAVQYFSYAVAGIPYMGVGRNLLYAKNRYEKVGGFRNHLDIASGDDDLLIQDMASRENVALCLDPDTYLFSEAPDSWSQFFRQKHRHQSTSHRYELKHQILLAAFAASQMLFYLCVILSFFTGEAIIAGTLWIFKVVVQWVILFGIAVKMSEWRFISYVPLLDIAYALYLWVMAPLTLLKKNTSWN